MAPPKLQILYPSLIERNFVRDTGKIIEMVREEVEKTLIPALDRWKREADLEAGRADAGGHWSDDVEETIKGLKAKAAEISASVHPLAESVSFSVDAWNAKQFDKVTKLLTPEAQAVTVFNPLNTQSAIKSVWAKTYAGLITQVTDEVISKVSKITFDGVMNGTSYQTMRQQLLARGPIEALKNPPFDTARKRSNLIARDQIGKLNGAIVSSRQQQLGIDRYIWRTSLDERVRGNPGGLYPKAKPSHYAREGQIFSWSQPPVGGHPGEAIMCRCYAEPYIDGVTGSKGVAGIQGKIIQPGMTLGKKIKALSNSAALALNYAEKAAATAQAASNEATAAMAEMEAALNELGASISSASEALKKSATVKASTIHAQAEAAHVKAVKAASDAALAGDKADEVLKSKIAGSGAKAQAMAAKAAISTADAALQQATNAFESVKLMKQQTADKLEAALTVKKENKALKLSAAEATKAAEALKVSQVVAPIEAGKLNGTLWKMVGEKQGSNPGGIFESPNGKRYIVKVMDREHIANEMLAAKLYEASGVAVSNLSIVEGLTFNGKKVTALAGEWIPDLSSAKTALSSAVIGPGGYIEGAGVDMWLANWDAIGLNMDNILVNSAGKLIRIDVGGALKMKAMAVNSTKPFPSDAVNELKTFLNGKNNQISPILSKYGSDDITRSLERVASFSDAQIEAIISKVAAEAGLTAAEATEYKTALIGRRDIIKKEWEDRGGPKLAGIVTDTAASPYTAAATAKSAPIHHHDPFNDYKPGDSIPGLSPTGGAFIEAAWSKGSISMKKALQAHGLEWDKAKVVYSQDIVDEVTKWKTEAESALSGKGKFPKPLDAAKIQKVTNDKIKAAEDAKKAQQQTQNALNFKLGAKATKSALIFSKEIPPSVSYAEAGMLVGKVQTYIEEAVQFLAKIPAAEYEHDALKTEIMAARASLAKAMSSPEFISLKNAANLAAKAGIKKAVGYNEGSAPAAIFPAAGSPGKVMISTADGLNIANLDILDYGLTNHSIGLYNDNAPNDHWLDVVTSKIDGPFTRGAKAENLKVRRVAPIGRAENFVNEYSGAAHGRHNKQLRGTAPIDADELQNYKAASDLIKKHTVTEPFVVWRGQGFNHLTNFTGGDLSTLVSTVYTENAFMSTTTDVTKAFSGTLMKILVPPGSKALPIRHLSRVSDEEEILFAPGTKMYIKEYKTLNSRSPENYGHHRDYTNMITCEVIPDGAPPPKKKRKATP